MFLCNWFVDRLTLDRFVFNCRCKTASLEYNDYEQWTQPYTCYTYMLWNYTVTAPRNAGQCAEWSLHERSEHGSAGWVSYERKLLTLSLLIPSFDTLTCIERSKEVEHAGRRGRTQEKKQVAWVLRSPVHKTSCQLGVYTQPRCYVQDDARRVSREHRDVVTSRSPGKLKIKLIRRTSAAWARHAMNYEFDFNLYSV